MFSFAGQRLFSSMWSYLFVFAFVCLAGGHTQEDDAKICVKERDLCLRVNYPLYHYVMSTFVSHCFLWLEFSLSCVSVATYTFFWLPFAWSIILHAFTLSLFIFRAEVSLLEVAYNWVLFFNPFSHPVFWLMNSAHLYLGQLLINENLVWPFYLLPFGCSVLSLFLSPEFLLAIFVWYFSVMFFSVSPFSCFRSLLHLYFLWLPRGLKRLSHG